MAESNDFLDEFLSRGPSAGSLFLILSRMKAEGRSGEVVRTCIRFLSQYPDDIRLRTLLAESYAEMGFITLAGSEFEKVVSMIDTLAPVYRSLAGIYEKQQRYSEATDMLRRYLAHYPDHPEAMASLKRMEAALLPEEAVFEIEDPEEDFATAGDDYEDALVDFASPTIAELYYSQGRIDAAIHTYEKVLSSNPTDRESLRRLNELKGMLSESEGFEEKRPSAARSQEDRLITILERWLPRIREIRYAS
ncbi:MAG: tetratricopeptide repeat protein [Deltaproteobacteria bacterium]|nr:tetratricopeptide repeat protein [Deltaproteobacteria bacterium]